MRLTLSMSLLALAAAPLPAQGVFERNLIVNGDAESGPGAVDHVSVSPPDGWSGMSGFTAVQYGAFGDFPSRFSPGPVDRGTNFLAGGPVDVAFGTGDAFSSGTQTADVTSGAATIDIGLVGYELEGFLGGWNEQEDNAVLTIEFLSGTSLTLGSDSIGPVLALDRGGNKGLLPRGTSGLVPIGTRSIKITLDMMRVARVDEKEGEYNDGYADSLSLILTPRPRPTEFKLTAGDAASLDRFGSSVALSGDTALVGAPMDDGAGSAYVFVRDATGSWSQQDKLTAGDAAAGDHFGTSVALSGDTALVGAPMDDGAGAAYVFVRDSNGSWSQQGKLTASDAAADDQFGTSVALSGDTALVGAPMDDDDGSASGAAYVFVRDVMGWSEQDKLTASDAAAGDQFGIAVALSGNTALVGAPMDDDAGADSGSAYVLVRSVMGWSQQDKLTASDAAAGDQFGFSAALTGDTALVGAPMDDGASADSGSAYVFVRSVTDWSQEDRLNPMDAGTQDVFGWSVALSGDRALVGSPQDGDAGANSGSAHVFVRDGPGSWSQQDKLTASDAEAGDIFGSAVALSGNTSLVGAPQDGDGGANSGSAYVYETSVVEYGTGVPGSGGLTPEIGTAGEVPNVGNSTFKIRITNAVGGAPCVIAGSLSRAAIPLLGGTLYGDFLTPNGFVALSFVTSGLSGFPGFGTATLPLRIPNDPTLIGFTTYWQGFVSDSGSPLASGVSHTGGLAVTVIR